MNLRPAVPVRTIAQAAVLHYLAYVVMQTMALFAETRRGPALPDLLLELVEPQRQLDWINQSVWVSVLFGTLIWMALFRPIAGVNYLRTGAVVCLLRGLSITLTSLGPPPAMAHSVPAVVLTLRPGDITFDLLLRQWIPLDILWGGSGLSAAHLTQDLFFSGHTASTFLFLLVLRRSRVFPVLLGFHIMVVTLLLLTHEHYSVDILGAYFATYAVWSFLAKRGWLLPEPPAADHRGHGEHGGKNVIQ